MRDAFLSHVKIASVESTERYITPILMFGDDDFFRAIRSNRICFDNKPRVLALRFVRGFPPSETLFVALPKEIRVSKDHVYELRAVIEMAEAQHAWAKGKRGDRWYEFDDETVHRIEEEDLLQVGDTSIVFYEYLG